LGKDNRSRLEEIHIFWGRQWSSIEHCCACSSIKLIIGKGHSLVQTIPWPHCIEGNVPVSTNRSPERNKPDDFCNPSIVLLEQLRKAGYFLLSIKACSIGASYG